MMGNGGSRSLSPLPDQSEESGMSSSGEGAGASRRKQPKKQSSGGSSTSPGEEMYAESIISVSSRRSHDKSEARNDRASASAPDDGDIVRSRDIIGPSTIVSDQTGSGSSTTSTSSQQQPFHLESGTDISMS